MSKKVWRSVMVAVLVVGFAVGPVGAAIAAPERGEEARAGWGVELGEWVEAFWGWLIETDEPSHPPAPLTPTESGSSECTGEECADARGGMDPNG